MGPAIDLGASVFVVDDDEFSARLLMRKLAEAGTASVSWIGNAEESRSVLALALQNVDASPKMLIVDLKSSSTATLDYVKAIATQAEAADLPVVAMAQSDDRAMRSALYAAGAAGVFVRYADRGAYRDEVRAIYKFWCGFRRPDAVGM